MRFLCWLIYHQHTVNRLEAYFKSIVTGYDDIDINLKETEGMHNLETEEKSDEEEEGTMSNNCLEIKNNPAKSKVVFNLETSFMVEGLILYLF